MHAIITQEVSSEHCPSIQAKSYKHLEVLSNTVYRAWKMLMQRRVKGALRKNPSKFVTASPTPKPLFLRKIATFIY